MVEKDVLKKSRSSSGFFVAEEFMSNYQKKTASTLELEQYAEEIAEKLRVLKSR